jgi:hypothetical protein
MSIRSAKLENFFILFFVRDRIGFEKAKISPRKKKIKKFLDLKSYFLWRARGFTWRLKVFIEVLI